MESASYSLYLDETGDRGLLNFNPQYPVLGLCGVVIDDKAYRSDIVPALDALKIATFGTAQLTLHYSAIMKKSGPYALFRDAARLHAFERDLANLVSRLPIAVVAAVINKQEYVNLAVPRPPKDPTWPRDLYLLAADFVVERFVELLEQRQGIGGRFVAEARGRREDDQLRAHYLSTLQKPTQFYSPERFSILPGEIEFKTKDDRVAGLEIADLFAPQIATRTLRADDARLLIWQAIRPKIWMRGDDGPGGVGLKTFPSQVGRTIMATPRDRLKSPEDP